MSTVVQRQMASSQQYWTLQANRAFTPFSKQNIFFKNFLTKMDHILLNIRLLAFKIHYDLTIVHSPYIYVVSLPKFHSLSF